MIKLYQFDELRPEEILNRDIRAEKNVEDVVDGILADVRARGDAALKEYALKFDGASIEELQVTQAEIDAAIQEWNGNIESKHAVVRYMKDHAREKDTAAWLRRGHF